jgi:hypothetical protein
MKIFRKTLGILFALGTLFAVVPNALALTKAFQINTASGGSLTTGLVSYWNMQGNSNDYWGANNGTDTAVTYGAPYGKVSQGANFNGSASYIALPNNSGTYPTGNTWSMAAWVYFNGTGGSEVYQFGNAYFIEGLSATTVQTRYYDGTSDRTITVSTTVSVGWHFFVWTHDGVVGGKLYMDNSLIGTSSYTSSNFGGYANVFIGRSGSPIGVGYFSGYIDEFGIWSKALSTNEISDLYNGGAGQTMCNGTGGPLCGKHKIILISLNWKPEPIA